MRTDETTAGASADLSGWLSGRGLAWRRVIAGGAAVGLAARVGMTWATPGLVVWAIGLALLAIGDLERMVLPTRQVYATLGLTAGWLLVAAGVQGSWDRLGRTVLAAAVTEAVFAVLALAWPGSLGFGDVRLVGLIGVGVGWVAPLLIAVAVSAGFAAAGFVALVGLATGRLSGRSRLPVGAFLAAAAVVTVVVRG